MTPDIDHPDLPLVALFHAWPHTARAFWAHGTACVGCPIAPFHTVADACREYRLDQAAFRAALRAAAAAAGQEAGASAAPAGGEGVTRASSSADAGSSNARSPRL